MSPAIGRGCGRALGSGAPLSAMDLSHTVTNIARCNSPQTSIDIINGIAVAMMMTTRSGNAALNEGSLRAIKTASTPMMKPNSTVTIASFW